MDSKQVIMLTLQVSILATVFGFGLKARRGDLLYLWRQPRLLFRSLLAMYLAMPLVALAFVSIFDLPMNVRIVLVALSIAPLPPLLPKRDIEAGGHEAYAIALMSTLALLSIVITPLAVAVLGTYFKQPFVMSPASVAKTILVAVVLPLAAGLAMRALLADGAERIADVVMRVGQVLLICAALALVGVNLPALWAQVGGGVVLALAGFVVAGMLIGHFLGGPSADDRVVLALSTANRHPVIALSIATANFPEERVGATIMLYLLVGIAAGLPYTFLQRRKAARLASAR
jgi:BASS family bile acid:Na+ symporter